MPTFSFSSIGSALEMNGHSISTSNSGYFWPEIVTKRTIIWFLVYLSFSIIPMGNPAECIISCHGNGESTKQNNRITSLNILLIYYVLIVY